MLIRCDDGSILGTHGLHHAGDNARHVGALVVIPLALIVTDDDGGGRWLDRGREDVLVDCSVAVCLVVVIKVDGIGVGLGQWSTSNRPDTAEQQGGEDGELEDQQLAQSWKLQVMDKLTFIVKTGS